MSIHHNSFLFTFSWQINSKYSEEHAQEVLEWIRELTGEPDNTSGDPDNIYQHLRDGTLLCKYNNKIVVVHRLVHEIISIFKKK